MLTWTEAFITVEWIIRLLMLPIVTHGRRPNSAMAWLLVIFFEPVVGLVLFLLFGEYRLPSRRVRRHSKLAERIQSVANRYRRHPNIVHPQLGERTDETVRLALRLGSMPILGGNDVELITETGDFVDRMIADVDAAQNHAHLLFYIWGPDETGRRVADALIRAAERGVDCRVLVDAVGSRRMLAELAPRMREGGVEVHAALPVGLFRRSVSRLDLRNHRKLAVFDGRIAYTGSQNVVDDDYGHGALSWHDISVRLTGPIVIELQIVFLQDWFFETDEILESEELFPEPVHTGEIPVQTLPSGPNYPTENYHRVVTSAIYSARERVVITTPYFVPDEPLLQALQVAVLRGVAVDLVVPEHSDQIIVAEAGRAYYEDVLDLGGRLYQYKPGLLHAKTITVDDTIALIGTSNFDVRSFTLNFELNLLLYGEQVTTELIRRQDEYIARSESLDAETWNARPLPRRVFQNVCRLFSSML